MNGRMWLPFASVSAVRVPNGDVAMITAPAIPRPVGSMTFPASVPVVISWADAGVAVISSARISAAHVIPFLMVVFLPKSIIVAALRRPRSDSKSRNRNIGSECRNARKERLWRARDYETVINRPAGRVRGPSELQKRAEIAGESRVEQLQPLVLAARLIEALRGGQGQREAVVRRGVVGIDRERAGEGVGRLRVAARRPERDAHVEVGEEEARVQGGGAREVLDGGLGAADPETPGPALHQQDIGFAGQARRLVEKTQRPVGLVVPRQKQRLREEAGGRAGEVSCRRRGR